MSDNFSLISIQHLLHLFLIREKKDLIFNIPKNLIFKPDENDAFRTSQFDQLLETPIGVAAGPHTQMAQNIIIAWLCGARYIELKTVQHLDRLEVSKPCIDMQDEGYNCEWSQELRVHESYDEYLNAWIIIHLLKDKLGYTNQKGGVGTIFNISVGYDMEGILKENVQWFLEKMNNCKAEKETKIKSLINQYPNIENIDIPNCISDNVTLSTMHGCPPDEIEKIGLYLIEKKKLHTYIKLNPTLLGAKTVREILNQRLGFNTTVPDDAFEHDLKYNDALKIIKSLQKSAKKNNVTFGLKLTNTLECLNAKDVFPENEKMVYMSGRALHPVTINLAKKLQNDFNGELNISLSGGADCFNVADIIACGLSPVTVCSDLLKPGGYARLHQYIQELQKQFKQYNAQNIDEFILNKSHSKSGKAALFNLNKYAEEVIGQKSYQKLSVREPDIKTGRELGYFDCIAAPCVDKCPANQNIPEYMYYTSTGEFQKAFNVIMQTNPFPSVTGMVCDHLCQTKCTRINYDNPLLIREIKRFIAERNLQCDVIPAKNTGIKVAIIGAGPSGLSCAYFLTLAGFEVNVYENKSFAGGMVSDAIPSFRLPDDDIYRDIKRIENLGVNIHYNTKIDKIIFEDLQQNNHFIYLAVGAQVSKKLNIESEDAKGVIDPLKFLSEVRNGNKVELGNKVAVIGGGNTAMDAARTANRLIRDGGQITIVYRRSKAEMPADIEEINAAIDEGVKLLELTAPAKINIDNGKVKSLICYKMKLMEKDRSGRSRPVKIDGSEFELPFETIIPAIGQDLNIDFIDNNLLTADPVTKETRIKNLYIGGDAFRGASSVINAIGDGQEAAKNIIEASKKNHNLKPVYSDKGISYTGHLITRAKRIYGLPLQETDIAMRKNFEMVISGLTEKQAKEEASRCLYCDDVCNICVTVCPNLANYPYEVEPVEYKLQKAVRRNGKVIFEEDQVFRVEQKYQILNIDDFCNECGNCTTFCPTNGSPFIDKPNFYLTQKSFDEAESGYFIKKSNNKIILIHKGEKSSVSITLDNNIYIFENEDIIAKFNKENFRIIKVKFKRQNIRQASFRVAAEMSILLEGAKDLYI